MKHLCRNLVFAGLILMSMILACSGMVDPDSLVLGKVGGVRVRRGDITHVLFKMRLNSTETDTMKLYRFALDHYMTQKLFFLEADRQGIRVTEREIKDAVKREIKTQGYNMEAVSRLLGGDIGEVPETMKSPDEIRESLLVRKLLAKRLGNPPEITEKRILDFYNDNMSFYQVPCVGILKLESSSAKSAQRIADRLAGSETLEDIAKEMGRRFREDVAYDLKRENLDVRKSALSYSSIIDTPTMDVSYVSIAALSPKEQEAVMKMNVGDTAPMINTFSEHYVALKLFYKGDRIPIEAVSGSIAEQVRSNDLKTRLDDFLAELKEEFGFKIYENRILEASRLNM